MFNKTTVARSDASAAIVCSARRTIASRSKPGSKSHSPGLLTMGSARASATAVSIRRRVSKIAI